MADTDGLPVSVPGGVVAVAGYVDGRSNLPALFEKFPGMAHVTITALGTPGARVLDWESGNYEHPQWAAGEVAAGRRPTIYFNPHTDPDVPAQLASVGVHFGVNADRWTVRVGATGLDPGDCATQYTQAADWDLSWADSAWLGLDPPAIDPPAPLSTGDDDVFYLKHKETGTFYVGFFGGVYQLGAGADPASFVGVPYLGEWETPALQYLVGTFPPKSAQASPTPPA